MTKEKITRCSKITLNPSIDIGSLLLSKGVNVVATEGGYDKEKDECIIIVYIHSDDEKKNHELPREYEGFRIMYNYYGSSIEFASKQ